MDVDETSGALVPIRVTDHSDHLPSHNGRRRGQEDRLQHSMGVKTHVFPTGIITDVVVALAVNHGVDGSCKGRVGDGGAAGHGHGVERGASRC